MQYTKILHLNTCLFLSFATDFNQSGKEVRQDLLNELLGNAGYHRY
jgi:hypothetical protein